MSAHSCYDCYMALGLMTLYYFLKGSLIFALAFPIGCAIKDGARTFLYGS